MNKHWHADWFQLFLSVISKVSVKSILDMAEYAIFIVADISAANYLFAVKQCLQKRVEISIEQELKNRVIIFS